MSTESEEGDDYERRYMSGDGEVLHRAKMKAPLWFMLIFIVPILLELATFSTLAAMSKLPPSLWILPAIHGPIFFLLAMMFSVLRVTVSKEVVHVQYGLFGPKIPVSAIESADVVSYDWKQAGGYGIRRARDGSWVYNMVGDGGRAVKIVWNKKGKRVVHLLAAPNPDAVAGAIARARIGSLRKIRAAAPLGASELDELEAEESDGKDGKTAIAAREK